MLTADGCMLMADRFLTLYSRPGCHLCEAAAALLDRLGAEFGFQYETVNIERDPALESRYGEAVPVIADGKDEIVRAPIAPRSLRAALRARWGR